MVDIQSSTPTKMARIKEFQDTEHPIWEKRRLKKQDLSFIRGFLCGTYSMIRSSRFEARTNLLSNSCWPLGTTSGIDEHAINSHFAIENEQYGIIRSSTANQGLLHLTFQNSPVCHFISKIHEA